MSPNEITALEQLACAPWPQPEKEALRQGKKSLWLGRIFKRESCSKEELFQIITPLLSDAKYRQTILKIVSHLDQEQFFALLQAPQENTVKVKYGNESPVFYYIDKDILPYFKAVKNFKEGKEGQI